MAEKKSEYGKVLRRCVDIKPGRILALPGDKPGAWWSESMNPIARSMTIRVDEVKGWKGLGAKVTGTPVTQAGVPRRNAEPVRIVVRDGSFVVFVPEDTPEDE